jgi:hypothetical protein
MQADRNENCHYAGCKRRSDHASRLLGGPSIAR